MCRCSRRNRSTPTAPTVLGAPNGDPARRVRATATFTDMRYGEHAWVSGSKVDAYLTAGLLQPGE